MLQREVADRLAAPPGSKRVRRAVDSCVQLDADVEPLLTLPPGAFRPPPQVWSSVVRLHVPPAAGRLSPTAALFDALVRSLFAQRRKMLGNALRPLAAVGGLDGAAALRRGRHRSGAAARDAAACGTGKACGRASLPATRPAVV